MLPSVDLSDLMIGTPEECFEWQGSLAGKGYGVVWPRRGRRSVYVHRIVYELCFGPIPPKLVVHHKCENKRCANPLHLEVRSQRSNILEGASASAVNARKTHCLKCGSEFTVLKSGRRRCRPCTTQYEHDYFQWRKLGARA